ncbi:MAG: PKD domain-containing protein [Thermoplasmatota archaeon]
MYKKALGIWLISSILFSALLITAGGDFSEAGTTRSDEKWTILVYMSGDCDLESEMIGDFNELEMIGSGDGLDIIVQLDRYENDDTSNGDWTDTRRYRILRDEDPSLMNSERLDSPPLGELDMGDPGTMVDFLKFGFDNYPADRYLISLGGHSDGVTGYFCPDNKPPSSKMSLQEFGHSFRQVVDEELGRPVDVLALDACWMGMAEAVAEVKDHARYFVGSFDETPGTGWPYDLCVPHLLETDRTMEERLAGVVDSFIGAYSEDFASLSAVDVEAFRDQFLPVWKNLSEEMFYTSSDSRAVYSAAANSADHPKIKDDMIDIYHFARLLSSNSKLDIRVRAWVDELLATEDSVVIHSRAGSYHTDGSSLFGVHFTRGSVYQNYIDTEFSKLTAWDDFLTLHISEVDLSPVRINWTAEPPSRIDFELRTKSPSLLSNVEVEIREQTSVNSISLSGSGGLFTGSMESSSMESFDYRYLITTVYGDHITFPPDGFDRVEFRAEDDPPEIWHAVPYVINAASANSGIVLFASDRTGVDLSTSVLYYREADSDSWYSIPLQKSGYEAFRGWIKTTAYPEWIEPGSTFHYHIVINDTLGNSARYPETGEWTSVLGSANRFYIDGFHSDLAGFTLLLDKINATGAEQDVYQSDIAEGSLTGYKAYVLIAPDVPLTAEEADLIIDFLQNGGEMLLLIDPADGEQIVSARLLLEALDLETVPESYNDLYPQNPESELGGSLPTVSGNSDGSFEIPDNSIPVYYTKMPYVAMGTIWKGQGRIVYSVTDLFENGVMGRSANLQLAALVTEYLSKNIDPVLKYEIDPIGTVEVGAALTLDMSDSYDPDGVIVGYSALISGNFYSEGPDPVITYTFDQSGLFSIVLTVTDAEGGETTETFTVRANRPPTDGMGMSATVVHAGDEVLFNYKGSDPDGDDITVLWMFGDGAAKSGEIVSHIYRYKGIFNITMIVRDSAGLQITMESIIQVVNSDPVAVIDKDTISVNSKPASFTGPLRITLAVDEGDLVSISGIMSTDADHTDNLNFTWDMGDGSIYDAAEVEHVFRDSGLHVVNLTVEDGFGGIGHAELPVLVSNNPPTAFFKYERAGDRIRFNASDSVDDSWDMGGFVYHWDFGDGSKLTTSDPVAYHEYSFGGKYDVNLTVEDPEGDRGYHSVEVNAPGMRIIDWLIIIIVCFIVAAVIGSVIYVYARKRMEAEDKGLLELLGMRVEREDGEEDPGGFRSVERPHLAEARIRDFSKPRPVSDERHPKMRSRGGDIGKKEHPDHARNLEGLKK